MKRIALITAFVTAIALLNSNDGSIEFDVAVGEWPIVQAA